MFFFSLLLLSVNCRRTFLHVWLKLFFSYEISKVFFLFFFHPFIGRLAEMCRKDWIREKEWETERKLSTINQCQATLNDERFMLRQVFYWILSGNGNSNTYRHTHRWVEGKEIYVCCIKESIVLCIHMAACGKGSYQMCRHIIYAWKLARYWHISLYFNFKVR